MTALRSLFDHASVSVLFIGAVTWIISYIVYQRLFSPLASIPGPFLASVSRLWITILSFKGDTHRVIPELHQHYGKLVRIAPDEISIADPAVVKEVYGAGSKFRKSSWYSVWQGHRKLDLFAERDERVHGAQRKLVSRAYAMETLKDLEPHIDGALATFCKRMDELQGSCIDLGKWLQLFAFDVIGEITFSKPFGFMERGEDDGSFASIDGILRCASWIGQVPWLFWFHDSLMPYIGNYLAINARHGSLRTFAVNSVASRKESGTDRPDMLSKWLAVQQQKPKEFDDAGVMSMATSNIGAGSDTTAISIRAVIYYLLKNPQCKDKLLAELDDAQKAGNLSDPVTLAEANKLPYLQAVMLEGLRCHPAVGMSLPRTVPEPGFNIQGQFLPAGTTVGTNAWVLHKDKSVFGSDADQFNPERWLQEDTSEMHRCFFTFGAGARLCIGKNISWMEMSKIIPTLMTRYTITLANPHAEWTTRSWWFVQQKGLEVQLTRREV